MTAVTVFDTDGANPYGREVAKLLQSAGFEVDAILPEDVEWLPDELNILKTQPFNRPSNAWSQIKRQVRTLLTTAAITLIRRRILVVIMTRSWPDQLALTLLAAFGAKLVIVAHDPVPKKPLPALDAFVRRNFWKCARVLVAHSGELRTQTEEASGRPAMVVPHLPFVHYAAWAKSVAPDVASEGVTRMLVLGQMRHDKGLDRLPAIFSFIPASERDQFSVGFAGRGDIDNIVRDTNAVVRVSRPASHQRLDDKDIAQALAETDVLIAPYPQVSASGSVVLALCRNIRVVAYDTGAIGDVLAADGLVPTGNEKAFAEALRQSRIDGRANPAEPMEVWQARSLDAWKRAVDQATR